MRREDLELDLIFLLRTVFCFNLILSFDSTSFGLYTKVNLLFRPVLSFNRILLKLIKFDLDFSCELICIIRTFPLVVFQNYQHSSSTQIFQLFCYLLSIGNE